MKGRLILLLCLGLSAAGCNSNDKQAVWGIYQEPVHPQALPPTTNAAEINVLWEKNLGSGATQGYAILKPLYTADGVYAASRSSVFKLSQQNGSTIWQRDLDSAIFSGVGADNSIAVVALDNGTVVAMKSDSGEILWQTPLSRQISAVPVVGTGRVVVRTASGLVIALNATTGKIAWSIERAVPGLSIHGDSAPVIIDDLVFIGLASGKIIAVNVVSGREYWETEVSFTKGRNELERLTDADTSPLIADSKLYTATYQGNVAALQWQDATVLWKAKVSSRLAMSLSGNKLLVTDELGEVIAIDAENGTILWTQESFRGRGMSRPLTIKQRVLAGDSNGNLYSLDLDDGTLLEKRKVVDGAVVALIAGQGQFAVFSSQGNMVALSLDNSQN